MWRAAMFAAFSWALAGVALAQAPVPSAAPPEARIACGALSLKTAISATDLKAFKDCREAEKADEEVSALRAARSVRIGSLPLSSIPGWIPLVTALVTLVGTVATFSITSLNRGAEAKRLGDSAASERRASTMQMLKGIGEGNLTLQRASMAHLIAQLAALQHTKPRGQRARDTIKLEKNTLAGVILSFLTDPNLDPKISKYLSDSLIEAVGIGLPKKKAGKKRKLPKTSPLARHNLQCAQLRNAYWANVDLRGVDFYDADFADASLRDAELAGTIFYGAKLKNTVLANANLTRANLEGAILEGTNLAGATLHGANLKGADLSAAKNLDQALFDDKIVYDAVTRWPTGFAPAHPSA